jgi:hypothetical protein
VPGKTWDELKPDYRARLRSHGITKRDYETNSAKLRSQRQAIRGHGKTPEHPERAAKNPTKFAVYIATRRDLEQQVIQRKLRLFGDRIRVHSGRSKANVAKYRPTVTNMRRFLAVPERQIDDFLQRIMDENGGRLSDEWLFIGYH